MAMRSGGTLYSCKHTVLNVVSHHDGEGVVGFDESLWPPVGGKSSLSHFAVESEVALLASFGFVLNRLIFFSLRRTPAMSITERERINLNG